MTSTLAMPNFLSICAFVAADPTFPSKPLNRMRSPLTRYTIGDVRTISHAIFG